MQNQTGLIWKNAKTFHLIGEQDMTSGNMCRHPHTRHSNNITVCTMITCSLCKSEVGLCQDTWGKQGKMSSCSSWRELWAGRGRSWWGQMSVTVEGRGEGWGLWCQLLRGWWWWWWSFKHHSMKCRSRNEHELNLSTVWAFVCLLSAPFWRLVLSKQPDLIQFI